MINVTKTFLPPLEEYQTILKRAWDTGWMTNRGVLVKELETQLKSYLGVSHIIAMTNGTLPLQIAIKALNLKGEIITTPFSYVATTSSIVWEGCTPVFVDIHPEYLTIDETKIEAAITPNTSAILATHVFGNPCAIDAIELIAKKHNLKVIYDAAHCFGVTYKGQSVFNYGDVSTCSFHSTKLFHTGEGGALFCNDEDLLNALFYHHNFGHDGPLDFHGLGINAKISELQGAMGLAVLPYMKTILDARKKVVDYYLEAFINNYQIQLLKLRADIHWNYSYFPVMFKNETILLKVEQALKNNQINARRYFYPSLNTLPYVTSKDMKVSQSVASRILCLPLYVGLSKTDLKRIVQLIMDQIL
ncbi:DegT/DnrJ/EryC1/StrS family aminotransferase [Mesoflavibacter zeaxanthinifaciens]|uniref:DegT/DnrJ/EryC1/StrS family aminotransferase n=1 Tax=Mesoflavibacter zeaxanthinifaciens TaxID=393060 RepID=UPI000422CDA3|nr:DegT/DnrJ/EryC1/StrS family aminotransferase [Mesoflavibacter zeaxanthinifaciens]